jgi:hypothetical protein
MSDTAFETGFRERMAAAPVCPIAGPCPRCHERAPHYCVLGDILQWGPSPADAVRVALAGCRHLPLDVAEQELLSSLCREHRRLAERVMDRARFSLRAGTREDA